MAVLWSEVVRAIHVVAAALWFGGMMLGIVVVGPGVRAAGEAGGAFMGAMMRRGGFGRYLGPMGWLTVLSGAALYGLRGYLEAPFATRAAALVTVGALLTLVVLAAGLVVGRPMQARMKALSAAGPGEARELATLGGRMAKLGVATAALVGLTFLLMVGRNVIA